MFEEQGLIHFNEIQLSELVIHVVLLLVAFNKLVFLSVGIILHLVIRFSSSYQCLFKAQFLFLFYLFFVHT